jgi:uncharacterized surface protein with fasciclin (FAS1) repeats
MKKQLLLFLAFVMVAMMSCQPGDGNRQAAGTAAAPAAGTDSGTGQASVKDENSEQNIVKVAVGSADHTTLVTALKAAELVDALANVGPFTVFAPNNAAFSALPAGTVEGLLKPEKKGDLTNILKYHVTTSALTDIMLQNGMTLGMANGGKATIKRDGDKIMINDANVLGVVKASNGMVYVVDKVLLPQ